MPSEDSEKLSVGHYHEIMDRASMLLEMWDEHIQQLGVTKQTASLRELAEVVEKAMSDFYQATGMAHDKALEDEAKKEKDFLVEVRKMGDIEVPTDSGLGYRLTNGYAVFVNGAEQQPWLPLRDALRDASAIRESGLEVWNSKS